MVVQAKGTKAIPINRDHASIDRYLCIMSIRKEYRHVFFDLDETLWDFKRNSLETIYDLIEQHRLEERGIEKENFIRRYHHHNDIYWDLFRQGKISREELR